MGVEIFILFFGLMFWMYFCCVIVYGGCIDLKILISVVRGFYFFGFLLVFICLCLCYCGRYFNEYMLFIKKKIIGMLMFMSMYK